MKAPTLEIVCERPLVSSRLFPDLDNRWVARTAVISARTNGITSEIAAYCVDPSHVGVVIAYLLYIFIGGALDIFTRARFVVVRFLYSCIVSVAVPIPKSRCVICWVCVFVAEGCVFST